MQYKTVAAPVELEVKNEKDMEKAISAYASILNAEANNGWEFIRINQIPVSVNPGCCSCSAPSTTSFNMLVFGKTELSDSDNSVSSFNESILQNNATITSSNTSNESILQINFGNTDFVKSLKTSLSSLFISLPKGMRKYVISFALVCIISIFAVPIYFLCTHDSGKNSYSYSKGSYYSNERPSYSDNVERKSSSEKSNKHNVEKKSAPKKVYAKIYTLDGAMVRVRSKPGTDGTEVVGKLKNGTRIEVFEKSSLVETYEGIRSSWIYVTDGTVYGWIFGGYVKYE